MKHVLIMDDNMQLAFDWRDAFVLNGNEVTLCFNGDEAIAHLEKTRFDLVITDLFVANAMGGLHVVTKILAMKGKKPPTIAVTGTRLYSKAKDDMNFFLRQVKQLGVSATIEKPPYQGTLGCLRIPFARGVCGACATQKKTIIVADVHAFPGHIACDSQTNSEIVVPVFDEAGALFAVLDVDSTSLDSFGEDDKAGLEAICASLLVGASQA